MRKRSKNELKAQNDGRDNPNDDVIENTKRIEISNQRIKDNGAYFDYLFKIMESYVGTAKTYSGICTALFSISFFKIEAVSQALKQDNCSKWVLIVSWFFLGLSILSSAGYQYFSTGLIEDEAEFEGVNYSKFMNRLRCFYISMVASMIIGLFATMLFVYCYFVHA